MRMTTITKYKNVDAYKMKIDALDYSFLMTEDFILRFIQAYKILKNDPSKTVVIARDNDELDYADCVTSRFDRSIINYDPHLRTDDINE